MLTAAWLNSTTDCFGSSAGLRSRRSRNRSASGAARHGQNVGRGEDRSDQIRGEASHAFVPKEPRKLHGQSADPQICPTLSTAPKDLGVISLAQFRRRWCVKPDCGEDSWPGLRLIPSVSAGAWILAWVCSWIARAGPAGHLWPIMGKCWTGRNDAVGETDQLRNHGKRLLTASAG